MTQPQKESRFDGMTAAQQEAQLVAEQRAPIEISPVQVKTITDLAQEQTEKTGEVAE